MKNKNSSSQLDLLMEFFKKHSNENCLKEVKVLNQDELISFANILVIRTINRHSVTQLLKDRSVILLFAC